jgi:hypothetical protein
MAVISVEIFYEHLNHYLILHITTNANKNDMTTSHVFSLQVEEKTVIKNHDN